MTCSSRSASATSSSVARNAATSECGSRSMNPTVSDTSSSRRSGSRTLRTSGSSVTNSASDATASSPRQQVEQRGLAGVGVADQRDGRHRGLVAALAQLRAPAAGRRRSRSESMLMRCRMRRRSVSSFVSPGPRVPMPPPSRDSAVPDPTSRGSRYFSCASSTCSLPSRVRARRAKMSRISCVRSMTLRLERRLRGCGAVPASARCRR